MKYTNFKDNKVSLLGMGCMRLPLGADDKVDEAEAIRVIRHGIDSGITYIDTAYMYHNGFSERVICWQTKCRHGLPEARRISKRFSTNSSKDCRQTI